MIAYFANLTFSNPALKGLSFPLTAYLMKNLCRLALITGIAALSAVAFNPKAQAETKTVNFAATVAKLCSFSSTTSGTLAPGDGWLEAAGGIPGLEIGISGSTTLSCNGAATVSAGVPVKLSAPAGFDDTNRQSVVYDAETTNAASSSTGTRLWAGYTNSNIAVPADQSRVLKVAMSAGAAPGTAGNVVAGTYSYKVIVTATPN